MANPNTLPAVQPSAGVIVAQGETAASSVAARAKAEVEARAIVALNRPRHVEQFRLALLQACRRSRFAAGAWYSKPVGGAAVQGLSIRFAEEAARHYGNLHIGAQVVYDDAERRVIKVVATDLESNNTYDSDVTVQKTVERKKTKAGDEVIRSRTNSYGDTVYLIRADDDQLLNKQAALVSKARRQLILQHVPSDISEEASEIILETRKSEVDADPMAARKRMVDAFFSIGVGPEQLEEFLGHELDTVTKAEIHLLGSIYTGIREGEATWADVMEQKRGKPNGGATESSAPKSSNGATGTAKLADKLAEKGVGKKAKAEATVEAQVDAPKAEPPKSSAPKPSSYIAGLIARRDKGEALDGADLEELRQWEEIDSKEVARG